MTNTDSEATGAGDADQADQAGVDPVGAPGPPQFGSPVADKVYALLAASVATLQAELIDVEWTGGTLRLVVDAAGAGDAGAGVTTETLADVNRLVSPLLDQHDPVPGRYLLEVSSPGVERPLRRIDHFHRAIGEQVIVKLESWSEIRRVRGVLTAVDDAAVTIEAIEIDGVDLPEPEVHTIAHDDIAKARTHFEWGPTPKKGGKAGHAGGAGNRKPAGNNKNQKNRKKSGGGR